MVISCLLLQYDTLLRVNSVVPRYEKLAESINDKSSQCIPNAGPNKLFAKLVFAPPVTNYSIKVFCKYTPCFLYPLNFFLTLCHLPFIVFSVIIFFNFHLVISTFCFSVFLVFTFLYCDFACPLFALLPICLPNSK